MLSFGVRSILVLSLTFTRAVPRDCWAKTGVLKNAIKINNIAKKRTHRNCLFLSNNSCIIFYIVLLLGFVYLENLQYIKELCQCIMHKLIDTNYCSWQGGYKSSSDKILKPLFFNIVSVAALSVTLKAMYAISPFLLIIEYMYSMFMSSLFNI